jgi:nucleotide-binding universal stress UspA family protein
MEIKKILVPTDFSQTSLNALNYAAELAKENNAKIYLLHISFMPTFYINDLNNYSYYEADLHKAIAKVKAISESNLKALTNFSILKSVELITEVKLGYSIYSDILSYADKVKPDIIIMGSNSNKKVSFFNIGSNTERVIRTTDIPVLVVKKQMNPKKIRKIVFASNFENNAKRVFPFLLNLYKLYNPEIHLLYINTKSNFREYDDIKVQILRFKKLFPCNFKISVRAAVNIDDGIVKYANSIGADIIALGVKRRKALSLYLTDRITEGVISKTKTPVLAIDNPK